MTNRLMLCVLLGGLVSACGPAECKLDDPASCPQEQVCETVTGKDKPLCFAPVQLDGRVYDLSNSAGIAGASVVATDENGAPAGPAVTSGADGAYSLRVPSTRSDEKGAFVARKVLLRSQAKNFTRFPSGGRISLPVDTSAATRTEDGKPYILKTPQTDIGLSPVAQSAQNLPSIAGTVEMSAEQKSVMLVLEPGGATTLAASDGKFVFFNVPAGTFKVSGYSRGVNYTPVDVTVAGSDVTAVELKKSATSTATMSGSVQLVAGANNAGTSVVLVVESTFIEALGRGEVPPGLRAPESGAPNISGAWTIGGIPDGKYVVLAAFENDGNVRDPDPGISGTQLQHITVTNGALSPAVSPAFKVTAAVGLISPGKDGVEDTTATPTFRWETHSNADAYVLRVFDGLGNELWQVAIADKATVSLAYGGPALTAGQFYQWRVTAIRRLFPTSQTEELRGLFRVQ
ncbi:MAG: hypothetical protein Q8N23_13475 [Archangium sp.]|nr:hypothetical protein [Archangium sp.]MDP3153683.1 hypothetical protein [Archangium sp.]MDP3569268.1 hypothetical protein [Archangium sp.]